MTSEIRITPTNLLFSTEYIMILFSEVIGNIKTTQGQLDKLIKICVVKFMIYFYVLVMIMNEKF